MVFEQASIPLSLSSSLYEEHPLILVNQPFEKLTGYTSSEVIGQNCRLLQGEKTEANAVASLSQSIAEGVANEVTITNYRKDGSPFINHLFLFPIETHNPDETFFVGAQYDVSEAVTVSIINSRLESIENSLSDARTVMQSYGFNMLRKNAMLAHTVKNYIQKALFIESHNSDKPLINV